MTVAYRSKNFLSGSTTTSAVHSAPAGLADGDVMIVFLYKENTAAVTTPAGWTLGGAAITASDSSFRIETFSKLAASESGTYTFSWTGSAYRVSCLVAYSGSDVGQISEYVASGAENNKITLPTLVTDVNNVLIIPFGANYDYALTAATLTGYTVRERSDVIWIGDAIQATAGSTGALAITHASGSSQTAAIMTALSPANKWTPGFRAYRPPKAIRRFR